MKTTTKTEWQADGRARERRYVVTLDGTMSLVLTSEEADDSYCQACCSDEGHATEAEANRCLAKWFRDQASVYRSMAVLAEREAERTRKPTALERQHGTGCVEARRNRVTGALRQLYRPGTQSESPGWLVICEPHGSVLDVETRKRGSLAMAENDWCHYCQCVAEHTGPS